MEPTAARIDAAADALRVLLRFERPADACLRAWFRTRPKLGLRDRAFIAETAFAVIRHLRRLEYLTGGREARLLILGALVSVHGLAVRSLSSLLTPEEASRLAGIKSTVPAQEAAIRLSLPDWLHAELAAVYGSDELERLGRKLLEPAPLDLRVNVLRAGRDEVIAELKSDGFDAEATPWSPAGVRLRDKPSLERHPLLASGRAEVQDEGSQVVSYLVAPKRGQMVADFCAGAGGKTLAMGMLMRSEGRLYAFDTSERRLANLRPRLKRSGLSNVHPQLIDSENDARVKRLHGKLDAVLVDAPCSGTGTSRRNPDLKWRMNPDAIRELNEKQRSILRAAAKLAKPGGRLVYVTCSLLPAENEAVVTAFLDEHPQWEPADAYAVLASQGIQIPSEGRFLVLRPDVHGTDGFYAAVLQRRA